MELDILRKEYFELLKLKEVSTQALIAVKDYNTALRLAIVGIPESPSANNKKKTGLNGEEKKKCKQSVAIKKAKLLAMRGESGVTTPVVVANDKKRKAENDSPEIPRVKRAYKKRACLAKEPVVLTVAPSQYNVCVLKTTNLASGEDESSEQLVEQTSNIQEVIGNTSNSTSNSDSEDVNTYCASLTKTWAMESDPADDEKQACFTVTDTFQ